MHTVIAHNFSAFELHNDVKYSRKLQFINYIFLSFDVNVCAVWCDCAFFTDYLVVQLEQTIQFSASFLSFSFQILTFDPYNLCPRCRLCWFTLTPSRSGSKVKAEVHCHWRENLSKLSVWPRAVAVWLCLVCFVVGQVSDVFCSIALQRHF